MPFPKTTIECTERWPNPIEAMGHLLHRITVLEGIKERQDFAIARHQAHVDASLPMIRELRHELEQALVENERLNKALDERTTQLSTTKDKLAEKRIQLNALRKQFAEFFEED